ncbi:hypothetical protein [Modestobacter sp. KNN46-3]|uniref:hypothetical protein n=1 Tax=Modestobacter sp. KNN46-3 TaxID=2711218 RepID=UPI0013DE9F63|nr:hypothetical protein [Modestobacter sp. KNN46-3]
MKRSAIRRNPAAAFTRELVVKFSDDPDDALTVTVAPTGITPELRDEVNAVPALFAEMSELAKHAVDTEDGQLTPEEIEQATALEDRIRQALGGAVAALVVKWDLLDDDEQVIPPTPEALADFHVFELITIVDALMREVNGAPFGKTSRSSGGSGRSRSSRQGARRRS